jgi:hypothetical protein
MAGNAKETALWGGADVYIGPVGTAGPTDLTTPWADAWDLVGLLDGEEGFTEGREEESAEHYAWGGVLFRRTRSKHKRTFQFVALEDNATVFALVNPGSTRTTAGGVRTGVIKVPTSARFAVGFELRDGTRTKRRYAAEAEVQEVAEIKESETDPTVYDLTVVLFPEADGTLYRTVETDPDTAV